MIDQNQNSCENLKTAFVQGEKDYHTATDLSYSGPKIDTGVRPKLSENAKRGEISLKGATKPEFARELKEAIDREMGETEKKRFAKCPEPTASEKAKALEARFVLTLKDADKMDWSMKARLVGKDLKAKRYCDPTDNYAPVPPLK